MRDAGSAPPLLFVKTITMFTVMGRNAQTATPFASAVERTLMSIRTREMAQMLTGNSPKLNSCTKALNL